MPQNRGAIIGYYKVKYSQVTKPILFGSALMFFPVFFVAFIREPALLLNLFTLLKLLEIAAILSITSGIIFFVFFTISFLIIPERITVYSNGVATRNPRKNSHLDFMNWEDMISVSYRKILGNKYIYVKSRNEYENIWIPLNIQNRNSFISILQKTSSKAGILIQGFNDC